MALTCAVCGTQLDKTSGNVNEFFRTSAVQGDPASVLKTLCLCEECQQDFVSETVQDDQDILMDSDTLKDEFFDELEAWAKKAAILSFTEKDNEVTTIEDVEAFFDALSQLIAWHPDNSFKEYVDTTVDYKSTMAHDSSPNGCAEGCAACADEESRQRIFTDSDAIALDSVMEKCFRIVNSVPSAKDVYEFGMEAMRRASHAPAEPKPENPQPTRKVRVSSFSGSPLRIIMLPEPQSILMFDTEAAYQMAVDFNANKPEDENLTDFLDQNHVRYVQMPVHYVAFDVK